MNIIIYGGYGILGSAVRKKLEHDNNIFIVDEYGDIDKKDPAYVGMTLRNIEEVLNSTMGKQTIVIDLTETCSIDQLDSASNIMSNVSNCARLMEMCRIHSDTKFHPVTMFYGVWAEPPNQSTSMFAFCSKARKELALYYNKCNTVITRVDIPRIISGRYPATLFNSIIARILDCIEDKQQVRTIMFDPQEFVAFNNVKWISADIAAEELCKNINRRTRTQLYIPGIAATVQHIIGTILDIADIEEIEIQTHRHGTYFFTKADMTKELPDGQLLREWIKYGIWEYDNSHREEDLD